MLRRRSGRDERMESDKRSRNWVDPSVYLSVRDADLLEDGMVLQRGDMIAIHVHPMMREPPAVPYVPVCVVWGGHDFQHSTI